MRCRTLRSKPKSRGQTAAHETWQKLVAAAQKLIAAGRLPADVLREPFVWNWDGEKLPWDPKTRDLSKELAEQNVKNPGRSFFVFDIERHPFYTNGPSKMHPNSFALLE